MEAQTLRPEAARLAAALEPSQARGREVMRVAPAERAAAVAALRATCTVGCSGRRGYSGRSNGKAW